MKNTKRCLVAALLLAGINQNASLAGPLEDGLVEAIENDESAQAIDWLNKGADPNIKLFNLINGSLHYSKRPLHYAVEEGNPEMVKLLLEKGANTEDKDWDDCAPLYKAVGCTNLYTNQHVFFGESHPTAEKRIEVIKLLLDKGANPNSKNRHADGPLHCVAKMVVVAACYKADESCYADSQAEVVSRPITIVKLLLDAGAKKDMRDLSNHTPHDTLQHQLKVYPRVTRLPQVKSGVEKLMNSLRLQSTKSVYGTH